MISHHHRPFVGLVLGRYIRSLSLWVQTPVTFSVRYGRTLEVCLEMEDFKKTGTFRSPRLLREALVEIALIFCCMNFNVAKNFYFDFRKPLRKLVC